jgi:hypothetical protein
MVIITEVAKAIIEVILYVNPNSLCLWYIKVLAKFKVPKTIKAVGII